MTYLLEGVAVLVGLAGVAATMSAQTIARTREFGMLRHIGVSKRQIVAMLASEGALLGLVVPGVEVEDVATTAKTFPGFADAWTSLVAGSEDKVEVGA